VLLSGSAEKRLSEITPSGYTASVHLSLSDDYPYSQAYAIVEALKD